MQGGTAGRSLRHRRNQMSSRYIHWFSADEDGVQASITSPLTRLLWNTSTLITNVWYGLNVDVFRYIHWFSADEHSIQPSITSPPTRLSWNTPTLSPNQTLVIW